MTTHHSTKGEVYVGANKVGEVNDFTLSKEASFEEDTPGDETYVTYAPESIKRWSGELNCWWDPDDTNGQEAIAEGNSVTLFLRPEGTATGLQEYTGVALITGVTIVKPKPGIVERRITFVGDDVLTEQAQS